MVTIEQLEDLAEALADIAVNFEYKDISELETEFLDALKDEFLRS